jgi:hypothetical protein
LSRKLEGYAEIGVLYYVVYDPQRHLSEETLRVFVLRDGEYQELEQPALPRIGLRLMRWDGVFEGHFDTWLRWCDAQGRLLLTGEERAALEAERAEREAERADQEAGARRQAEEHARVEAERAARLAEKLRELGINPEQV